MIVARFPPAWDIILVVIDFPLVLSVQDTKRDHPEQPGDEPVASFHYVGLEEAEPQLLIGPSYRPAVVVSGCEFIS
jgi:hypothetical protein